jgi:hypothetical protein
MYPAAMAYSIRAAIPGDEQTSFGLIEGLARYARLAHEVTGNAPALREPLFGARPAAEALLADQQSGGQAVGIALYFTNYPTLAVRVISPIRPLW